jgi:hypothetical protein
MSTRFFHIEKRGLFMIGSIFPACYRFRGICKAEEIFGTAFLELEHLGSSQNTVWWWIAFGLSGFSHGGADG